MPQVYVFYRSWMGFRKSVPFEQFERLPDSEILDAIEHHAVEWLRTDRAAVKALLRERRRQWRKERANEPTRLLPP